MKQNQKQMKRDRDFNLRLSEPEYIYLLMALHVTLMPMVRRIMVLHLPVLSLPNIILPTPMYSLTAHSIKN